jgi:hypothetical protein
MTCPVGWPCDKWDGAVPGAEEGAAFAADGAEGPVAGDGFTVVGIPIGKLGPGLEVGGADPALELTVVAVALVSGNDVAGAGLAADVEDADEEEEGGEAAALDVLMTASIWLRLTRREFCRVARERVS